MLKDKSSCEIKLEIIRQIIWNCELLDIRESLISLKNNGFTSEDVYDLFESLRNYFSDCPEEDLILDVLDICSGFCNPSYKVW